MKKLLVLASLLLATVAGAARYAPATGSSVTIEGTSTLHAWTMTGATIKGQIDAASPDNAKVIVTIPVTSIKSEHSKMDKLMAEALKARQHPEIRYELLQSSLTKGSPEANFAVTAKGKLTIAGVSRDVELAVTGARNAEGKYVLTGSAPLKMTEFGIKPPTAMMGTIKTGDDVKVTFRWIVEPTR